MRYTDTAPTDPIYQQAERLRSLERQVAELQRLAAIRRSVVGWAERTTTAGPIGTTITDIGGLSVTFTAVENRLYLVEAFCPTLVTISVANEEMYWLIRDGAGTTIQTARGSTPSTSKNVPTLYAARPVTPPAGSATYKVAGATLSGTTSYYADSIQSMWIAVSDVGLA